MKENDAPSTSGRLTPLSFSSSKDFSNYRELPSKGYCRLFMAQRYGKWYILKGLQPQHAADPVYMAMLEKEFDTAVKLNHPNIVHTMDIENDPVAGPCIVMEYIDGRTLSRFQEEKPSAAKRRKVATQLLQAMCYYHSLQIVHRDLKPSNILITRNGDNVKLIDFGLADADDYAILKEPAYTEGYAAPEQMRSDGIVDCRTDLYAFGVILKQLFPHRYRSIVTRCTKTSPDRRYRDAVEVLRTFRHSIVMPAVAITLSGAFVAMIIILNMFRTPVSVEGVAVSSEDNKPQLIHSGHKTDDAFTEQLTTYATKAGRMSARQAVDLLQRYCDSLVCDYEERLSHNVFPSQLSATLGGVRNTLLSQRYMYFLLAHQQNGTTVGIDEKMYRMLYSPISNAVQTYSRIESTQQLPSYDKYTIPSAVQACEADIQAEVDALAAEVKKLNDFYVEYAFDSILACTKRYFPL